MTMAVNEQKYEVIYKNVISIIEYPSRLFRKPCELCAEPLRNI